MTTDDDDLYFEISYLADFVRLVPKQLLRTGCELDWDNNWILTEVIVKGGNFSGQYEANFMTLDFERFKQEFALLYDDLKGKATFDSLEGQLKLKIVGDGFGHFEMDVTAIDQPGIGAELTFVMTFDQTSIRKIVAQLNKITEQYPITGDFKIKNK